MDSALVQGRVLGRLLKVLNESQEPRALADLAPLCETSIDELRLTLDLLLPFEETVCLQGEMLSLRRKLDLIDEARVYQQSAGRGRVSVEPLITSTNTVLAEHCANAVNGDVLAAELQTAGRGRRGRSWLSALCSQLTFSLCWKFADANAAMGLSLVSGLSVIEALHPLQLPLTIKWPNDIYINGGKLCGVLVELIPAHELHWQWAVVGIGLNISADKKQREAAAADSADGRPLCALTDFVPELPWDRTELLTRLISVLRRNISLFERQGLTPFLPLWEHYDFLEDKSLTIELEDGEKLSGRAVGTDLKGQLMLRLSDGTQRAVPSGHILQVEQ